MADVTPEPEPLPNDDAEEVDADWDEWQAQLDQLNTEVES